jgi:hypothetical protein
MAPSISLYNHTTARFANGANAVGDTYKLMLCSAATFNAANTTLASITKTEISGNGYTAGGATLANVAVTTVATNNAKFDADDGEQSPPAAAALLPATPSSTTTPMPMIHRWHSSTLMAPSLPPMACRLWCSGMPTAL